MCACTHLTDFMVFVKGSYEPLQNSNYHAFTALKHLTWKGLVGNVGFRVSLIILAFFLFLLFLTEIADRAISK